MLIAATVGAPGRPWTRKFIGRKPGRDAGVKRIRVSGKQWLENQAGKRWRAVFRKP